MVFPRHSKYWTMQRLIACLLAWLIAGTAFIGTAAADTGFQVLISSTTVPAGSTAQIQFFLAKPASLANGELYIDLDPAVFGAVTAVTADGDAMGYGIVDGRHVDVSFSSGSGALGQTVGNPMFSLNVAILPGAAPGSVATVTADASRSPWRDGAYQQHSVFVTAGTVTVGGTLAVGNVQPGSGVLPAGTVIRIDGAGFSAEPWSISRPRSPPPRSSSPPRNST